jgi:hypothetical protein
MASAKSVTYGVSYLSLQKLPHHQAFTTKPNESYVQLHPTPPRPLLPSLATYVDEGTHMPVGARCHKASRV